MDNKETFSERTTENSNNRRPYSQNELNFMKNREFKHFRIGDVYAYHENCKHSYLVKKNGRKEKEILQNGNNGNCSVCWRLSKTPKNMYEESLDIIDKSYVMINSNYLYY
jgi:hypothetical protein